MDEYIYIPVLATRGLIVFPGNEMALEVGRKKSLIAISIAQNVNDNHLIIVSQTKPEQTEVDLHDLYSWGTLVTIINSRKGADNSQRILVRGLERVEIKSFFENDGTIYAEAVVRNTLVKDETTARAYYSAVRKALDNVSKGGVSLPSQVFTNNASFSLCDTIDSICNACPFPLTTKQELLQTLDLNERMDKLSNSILNLMTEKEIEQKIDRKIKDSMDGAQKEYILREKMKAIKEELGEEGENKTNAILEELENNPYPENIKAKVKEELEKLSQMQAMSPEASVVRGYIDVVMKTPWFKKTEDVDDISKVEYILNNDHFGLEKPKERIIEYLAVKKLTNSLKAPILCFVGAPGTGKTSLAISIAKALNRKLVKVSLGGVSDESELRGHRRTYIGAMPGKIIEGMKKAGVINPVFVLDEIDKLGKDYKGDPASALLEILDPEQNKMFEDNYLDEPYDLSNVLFIATANYIDNIPEPLRDRLEIIELSSYTEQEKLEIAKNYLIKKQVEQNGIKKLDFDDEAILEIIRKYTREAGVRQLERNIGTIARKVAVKSLKNKRTSTKVNDAKVKEYLGNPIFDFTKKEEDDKVGVVTGLAYTQYGGDILPIECVYFKGKGDLIITGNLGDIMKESANIALGYVKANADTYGIAPVLFEQNDIHIHCPEGAVPKDGPSAGVALTTVIVSCLSNKKIRSDVAMTGEVTLTGQVLPIGGLKEKSIAASRSGISTIFIPKENVKNIDDIPESVRNSLHIVPVSNVNDVLREVLR